MKWYEWKELGEYKGVKDLGSFLDMLMNYKRDHSHSINEQMDHVVNMIKSLEVEYNFPLSYKKWILQMSSTEPKVKVLEHILWRIPLDEL